jgi:hypothetical protein
MDTDFSQFADGHYQATRGLTRQAVYEVYANHIARCCRLSQFVHNLLRRIMPPYLPADWLLQGLDAYMESGETELTQPRKVPVIKGPAGGLKRPLGGIAYAEAGAACLKNRFE